MASAKKCDVCGNFFDIIESQKYGIVKNISVCNNKSVWIHLDVCQECLQKLCDFVENEERSKI